MGYQASISEIKECAEETIQVGGQTFGVALGDAISMGGEIMPDSTNSIGVFERLGEHWSDTVRGLGMLARSLGEAMLDAARIYQNDDKAAEEDLGRR